MLPSKAQAGTYNNIRVCMAVMEVFERGINLLNKSRGCISEDIYSEGVHNVYASLSPKYGTFKKEMKAIDVDNDDPLSGAAKKEASDSGNVDSSDGNDQS